MVDFQRKVRSADLTRLLTFTNGHTGEGWTNRADCLRDVYAWVASDDGRRLLLGSAVAVIAERGAVAGRWHAHAAVRRNGRLDYSGIIRSWSAHLESLGYHSATGTHRFHAGDDSGKHSDGFASSRVCARYLTKYLTKSLGTERGPKASKSYRCLDLTPFSSKPVFYQDADGFTIGFWFDSLPDEGG